MFLVRFLVWVTSLIPLSTVASLRSGSTNNNNKNINKASMQKDESTNLKMIFRLMHVA